MVYVALEAAEEPAKDGIDVEVLDLRTLLPLDEEAILATAAKTGKVIVLHEATLHRRAGRRVRGAASPSRPSSTSTRPIMRVAPPDTPVPYSPAARGSLPAERGEIVAPGASARCMQY